MFSDDRCFRMVGHLLRSCLWTSAVLVEIKVLNFIIIQLQRDGGCHIKPALPMNGCHMYPHFWHCCCIKEEGNCTLPSSLYCFDCLHIEDAFVWQNKHFFFFFCLHFLAKTKKKEKPKKTKKNRMITWHCVYLCVLYVKKLKIQIRELWIPCI